MVFIIANSYKVFNSSHALILHALLLSGAFKKHSGISSECQTIWTLVNQIGSDILSGMRSVICAGSH